MTPIPPKLRAEMADDPYYKKCCIPDETCNGRVEWHHAIIYGGRQVQEKFAILPVCKSHHARMSKFNDKCVHIALQRATEAEIRSITKAKDYFFEKKRLEAIYGK